MNFLFNLLIFLLPLSYSLNLVASSQKDIYSYEQKILDGIDPHDLKNVKSFSGYSPFVSPDTNITRLQEELEKKQEQSKTLETSYKNRDKVAILNRNKAFYAAHEIRLKDDLKGLKRKINSP